MYSDRWSPGLRQGDIFGRFPIPLLKGKGSWNYSGAFAGTLIQPPESVTMPTPSRWLIVVSHDCEFNELKNRTHFDVARLDDFNPKTTKEEFELAEFGNNYARAVEEKVKVALDTFYLDPVAGAFDAPMRANLACLAALPLVFLSEALKLKRAELTHETRVLFRRKVGVFFGRDADDIPDEEKRPMAEIIAERENGGTG